MRNLEIHNTTMSSECKENSVCVLENGFGHRESEEAAATALTSLVSAPKLNNENDDSEEHGEFEIPQRFTKSGRKRAVPFPMKLMKVLSAKEFEHIVTWTPSGKAFTIVNSKAFVADILPEHFKSAKYSSFTRKLHRWGFVRHYRGDESGAFFHPDFQKDRLDLAEQMSCNKTDSPIGPIACKAAQESLPKKNSTPVTNRTSAPVVRIEKSRPETDEIMARLQQQQLKSPDLTAERLNAAIEAEVTRRLNERIQVAALSHLSLMHQLGPTPAPPLSRQRWNAGAGSLQTQFLLLQQQKQRFGIDASCLGLSSGMPRLDSRGLNELPRTNIQGAKTA